MACAPGYWDVEEPQEDDLLFYNYLSAEALTPFRQAAKGADWENAPVEAARQIVAASAGPTRRQPRHPIFCVPRTG